MRQPSKMANGRIVQGSSAYTVNQAMSLGGHKAGKKGGKFSNKEKFRHCLSEVYSTGVFSNETITQWTERDDVLQTYTNTRTFFEGKQ